MEKSKLLEIRQMSENAKKFVKQIFLDNGYNVKKGVQQKLICTDFLVEKDGKKYTIEVRRGDIDCGKLYDIANDMSKYQKEKNYISVLVLFSKRD